MTQRLTSAILATGFAIASMLGHGGLHLLPGGHACHHALAATGPHAHSHSGSCAHSHSHAHSHSAHAQQAEGHAHEHPASPVPLEHEHDDCPLCQWHAQGQLTTVAATFTATDILSLDLVQSPPQVVSCEEWTPLFSRGPPLTGSSLPV